MTTDGCVMGAAPLWVLGAAPKLGCDWTFCRWGMGCTSSSSRIERRASTCDGGGGALSVSSYLPQNRFDGRGPLFFLAKAVTRVGDFAAPPVGHAAGCTTRVHSGVHSGRKLGCDSKFYRGGAV